MRGKGFKPNRLLRLRRESRNRNGRQQRDLRGRLRNRYVADVADLAMLLVRFVPVPVTRSLRGEQPDAQKQRDSQQPRGDSTFRLGFSEIHHNVVVTSDLQHVSITRYQFV